MGGEEKYQGNWRLGQEKDVARDSSRHQATRDPKPAASKTVPVSPMYGPRRKNLAPGKIPRPRRGAGFSNRGALYTDRLKIVSGPFRTPIRNQIVIVFHEIECVRGNVHTTNIREFMGVS